MQIYQIADEKLWAVADAKFIAIIPEGADVQFLFDGDTPMPESQLGPFLQACGYPLGELTPLEDAKAAKVAELMAAFKQTFAPVEALYPQEERETWPIQLEEARAVIADPATETPMLSSMVMFRKRGETPTQLAEEILMQNSLFRQLTGILSGQQQGMYKDIMEMTTTRAILDYEISFVIPPELAAYLG